MSLINNMFSNEKEFNMPEGFTITAHTGANKTVENTIPSLKVALASGADIVEFDLNVNKNGELVLSHDTPKDDKSPSFEEALLVVKEHEGIRINIDIKTTENIDKTQETIIKTGMLDRVFYTGVTEKFVADVREKSPRVAYYLNCNPTPIEVLSSAGCDKIVDHVIEVGAIGVNINHMLVNSNLVEACHKKNLLISVWTVNNENDMKKYLAMGVDNITSERPTILRNLISD